MCLSSENVKGMVFLGPDIELFSFSPCKNDSYYIIYYFVMVNCLDYYNHCCYYLKTACIHGCSAESLNVGVDASIW